MKSERLYLEEGDACLRLMALDGSGVAAQPERLDVIVIGGGQAGLSTGYHLAKQGLSFVILDASARIGDAWRKRWDSLRLFSPRYLDGLDGLPFPGAPRDSFPSKDEMADYLEAYAACFALPVRSGVRVDRVARTDRGYVVQAGARRFEAPQVVIAIGNYQQPRLPAFGRELAASVVQLHAGTYRNPSQLQPGGVLVVGAGNSGAEIALELGARHEVFLAGNGVAAVPFDIVSWAGRNVFCRLLMRLIFHRLLSVRNPIGRRARRKLLHGTTPLIRTKLAQLRAAGVQPVPRVAGVHEGRPVLQDGRVLDVANVIFCTGFHPDLSFIELPIFDADGEPQHRSGLVQNAPGLYFVGLHFLHAMSSGMIHGVGRDAARIARAARQRASEPR